MKKTHNRATRLLLLFACCFTLLIPRYAAGQSIATPTNYITLNPNDTSFVIDTTSLITWYKYTAGDVVTEIILSNYAFSDYDSITFWRTNGVQITFMSGSYNTAGTLNLLQSGLTTTNVYWFKVHKTSISRKVAGIYLDHRSTLTSVVCTSCPGALYDTTNTCEMVCNGHFDYTYNNTQPSVQDRLLNACPWHKPAYSPANPISTPDLLTSSGGTSVDIPSNLFGWQQSYTPGVGLGYTGYAGIFTYWGGDANSPADPDFREYVQADLNSTLLAGKQYVVSFRISRSDKSKWASKNIGAWVWTGAPTQSNCNYIPAALGGVQALATSYVTDTAGWQLVQGVFTASGTENTITIGQFTSDAGSVTAAPYSGAGINGAYYYIDDVSVRPYPDSIHVYANPNPICAGHTLTLTAATNVTNPYYFTWLGNPSASAGFLSNNNDTVKANPTADVTYKSIIHLANYGGCTINDTVRVDWLVGPTAVSAGADQTICTGGTATLIGNSSGPYDVSSWAVLNGSTLCTGCTTTGVSPTTATYYVYTVTYSVTGCTRRDTVKVTPVPLAVTIVSPPGATTCGGCFNFTTATAYSTYSWSTNAVTSSGGSTSTLNACWGSPYDTTGLSGNVSVSVVDANGCTGSIYMIVPSCCPFKDGQETVFPNVINDSTTHVDNVTYPTLYTYNVSNQYYEATNKQFSINGLYIVDRNTRWMGCEVKMGPNAKIIVRPGIKFEMTNSTGTTFTKLYACTDMWDGIYVDGTNATSKVTALNGTVIEDAKNAIVSTNGGNYFIDGGAYTCKFNKNNIGVLVKPYTGTHPGVIRKTIFSCDAPGQAGATAGVTFAGANCRAPVSGKGYAGVYIENCAAVTVGDSTASGYRNLFERTQFGIYSTLSNVKVWNNDFKYFTTTVVAPNMPANGIAVYAQATKQNPKTLTVGRQGNYKAKNKFTKCSNGVMTYNYMNLNCEFNRFDSCTTRGIYALNCLSKTILINQDTLTECIGTNISCVQVNNSTVTITNNSINNTQNFVSANYGNTGIYVANAVLANTNLKIQYNSVKKMRNGIWVSRVKGAKITDNAPISFMAGQPMSQLAPCIGIKLEEVTNSLIRQNSVAMQTNPTLAVHDEIFGIHMTNCKSDTVSKNQFSRMGSAIFLKGANNPCVLACNTMTTCWFGVNFNYLNANGVPVSVNDQITWPNTPYATGNTWGGGSLGSDLKGAIMMVSGNGIKWYYPTAGYNPSVSMISGSLFNGVTQPTGNGDRCNFMLAPPVQTPAGIRDNTLGGICKTPRTYDTLNAEYQYHDNVYAYRMLRENPSWKSLGTADDSYYANFYTTHTSGNIGKFADVEDDIAAGNVASATTTLSTITPSGQYEVNRKALLQVYLQTWAIDSMNLDSTQQAILLNIVNQGTLVGGTTVFDARNMLNLEVHDSSNVRVQNPIYSASTPNAVSPAYPNPSNGQVSIDVALEQDVPAVFELYDLSGRLVGAWQFIGGQGKYTFDASFVPSGTYIYRVRTEGEMLKSDRLIIIKE